MIYWGYSPTELEVTTNIYELTNYFFAYDMLNYARITPVYISQMYDLKERENDTESLSTVAVFP